MNLIHKIITIIWLGLFLTGCANPPSPPPPPGANPTSPNSSSAPVDTPNTFSETSTLKIKAEVWVDNWFAFYLGEQLIKEDAVSITTERSFNSETFTFDATYPLQLNFIVKDYKENDTGLEYIGSDRQQMGDGGFIAQFTNATTGQLLTVTDSNWVCLVIHKAPLDTSCEKARNPVAGQSPCEFKALDEPVGWKNVGFNASSWEHATLYTAQQVSPKEGYNDIHWNPAAKLIWGPDLKTDNTLLCRLIIEKAVP